MVGGIRFHLLTLILLCLCASAVLGLNLRSNADVKFIDVQGLPQGVAGPSGLRKIEVGGRSVYAGEVEEIKYGWPIVCYVVTAPLGNPADQTKSRSSAVQMEGVLANSLLTLALMVGVYFLGEKLVKSTGCARMSRISSPHDTPPSRPQ